MYEIRFFLKWSNCERTLFASYWLKTDLWIFFSKIPYCTCNFIMQHISSCIVSLCQYFTVCNAIWPHAHAFVLKHIFTKHMWLTATINVCYRTYHPYLITSALCWLSANCLFLKYSRRPLHYTPWQRTRDSFEQRRYRAPSQYKDRLIYVWRFPC